MTKSSGDKLKDMRMRCGYASIADAAKAIGIAKASYAQYESGRRQATLEQLHRFATAWGGDPHELDNRLRSIATREN